jgi:hypothetical protein
MTLDVEIAQRRFTVDEYHWMGEAGILTSRTGWKRISVSQ